MKGAVTVTTAMMTTIFGTKVSVISCTCVSAWNRAITTPTTMAARMAGPEAAITVQSAAWTMSNASASFILADLDPVRDQDLRAALERCHHARFRERDGRDPAADRSVGGDERAPDDGVGLGQHRVRHQGVELGVRLDRLLDGRERRELRHVLRAVHRLREVLIADLRDQEAQEGVVIDRW